MVDPAPPLRCPRCDADLRGARFYGPCEDCRLSLRRAMAKPAQARERAAFEPAMHVTPNAVALKE